ncbi:MAG: CHAT domain-containing protein, partial [Verrucomicrobia bacterium]|nr:CHAT domain-containing protein [Verrucomicrobiota bacterium]
LKHSPGGAWGVLEPYRELPRFPQTRFPTLIPSLTPHPTPSITEIALNNPDTALFLNSVAALYFNKGDYAKAEPLLERALKICEKALGSDHPSTARAIHNLAILYVWRGKYAKAEPALEQALRILEKVLGQDHPDTGVVFFNLALLFLDMNNKPVARAMAAKAQQAELKTISGILSYTSERQRLAYQASLNPYALSASLGEAQRVARTLLRYKGIVLDSILEDQLVARTSQKPEQRKLVDQLRGGKARLTQLLLEVPKDFSPEARDKREAEKNKLANEVEQLEGTLARQVAGLGRARRALSVTVEQVQKAIPRQTVLLELLRYSHYLGTNNGEARYGAVILASSGEPKWVPLGSAEAIEKNVTAYQAAVRGGAMEERGAFEQGERVGSETERRGVGVSVRGEPKSQIANPKSEFINHKSELFSTLLQALYQQLWAPIEAALPKGTRTVIISPDGALNFLSYATLLTPDDQFLSQKYSIRYVSSGRDLLKEKKPSPNKRVAIYANPDFSVVAMSPKSSDAAVPLTPALSPEEREKSGPALGQSKVADSSPSRATGFPLPKGEGEGEGKGGTGSTTNGLLASAASPPSETAMRYLDRRDLQDLHLSSLPGTARESAALTAQAQKWNWPADVFLGPEASEAQLTTVESPRILHLATHGFFLPDVGEDGKTGGRELRGVGGVRPNFEPSPMGSLPGGGFESGMIGGFNRPVALKNPMHRSGLALAGAQATLDAWKRGETPPTSNDGIVTADEVGTLKLEGTELVVLSACDTGIGEIKSGEGVLGLRRGFIQAGAENLLMTLWSVADEETAKIMADFYETFHASGNAPQALAEVQRDWLIKLRKERELEFAVRIAGPFVLSSQGP